LKCSPLGTGPWNIFATPFWGNSANFLFLQSIFFSISENIKFGITSISLCPYRWSYYFEAAFLIAVYKSGSPLIWINLTGRPVPDRNKNCEFLGIAKKILGNVAGVYGAYLLGSYRIGYEASC